jgi:hypothetical protein
MPAQAGLENVAIQINIPSLVEIINLNVLPSNVAGGDIKATSKGLKAKAVVDLARGNGSVLQSSVHLPDGGSARGVASGRAGSGASSRLGVGDRASHEARCTLAVVGPGSQRVLRVAGSVDEGAGRGASGHVGGVRGGEAQSTGAVNVDSLATGDRDIKSVLAVDDGVVGAARAARNNLAGAVGGALSTKEKVRAGGSQREEMDGRARASGDDTKSTVGILSLGGTNARAGEGSDEGNERQKSGNLHCDRIRK